MLKLFISLAVLLLISAWVILPLGFGWDVLDLFSVSSFIPGSVMQVKWEYWRWVGLKCHLGAAFSLERRQPIFSWMPQWVLNL